MFLPTEARDIRGTQADILKALLTAIILIHILMTKTVLEQAKP